MKRAISRLILVEQEQRFRSRSASTLPITSDLLLNFAEGPTIHQRVYITASPENWCRQVNTASGAG